MCALNIWFVAVPEAVAGVAALPRTSSCYLAKVLIDFRYCGNGKPSPSICTSFGGTDAMNTRRSLRSDYRHTNRGSVPRFPLLTTAEVASRLNTSVRKVCLMAECQEIRAL